MSAGQRVEEARGCEWGCLNTSDAGYFASSRAHSEVCWVEAVIALLQWAPPVEARPKLHGPSPEALARGMVVGAVVRFNGVNGWHAVVIGHSECGYPITTRGGSYYPNQLTVVLPPPALDSWLLDAHIVESYVHHAAVPRFIAEARRLVELVRGGAR